MISQLINMINNYDYEYLLLNTNFCYRYIPDRFKPQDFFLYKYEMVLGERTDPENFQKGECGCDPKIVPLPKRA